MRILKWLDSALKIYNINEHSEQIDYTFYKYGYLHKYLAHLIWWASENIMLISFLFEMSGWLSFGGWTSQETVITAAWFRVGGDAIHHSGHPWPSRLTFKHSNIQPVLAQYRASDFDGGPALTQQTRHVKTMMF